MSISKGNGAVMSEAEVQKIAAAVPERSAAVHVAGLHPMPFLAGSERILERIARTAAPALHAHGAGLSIASAGKDHLIIARGVFKRLVRPAPPPPIIRFSEGDTDTLQ